MNISNELKQTFFILLIIVLLFGVLFVYWISPQISEQGDREVQLMEQKRTVMDLEWQVKRMQQNGLVERFYIAATRRAVPEEPKLEGLWHDTRSLELITTIPFSSYNWQEDLTPISVTTRTANGTGQVEVIPLRFTHSFTGTYENISQLLQEIEDLPRLMVVKQLTIQGQPASPVGENDINRQLNTNLVIESYYAPALKNVVEPKDELKFSTPKFKKQPFQ